METLQLKHIKGYLGTGLKGQTKGYNDAIECSLLTGIKDDDYYETEVIIETKMTNITAKRSICIHGFKPYLHPLSSLTKEITHNGETFIPLVKYVESLGEPVYDFDELNLTDYENACLSMLTTYEMRHQQDLEFLQGYHFDYQNLIELGLAISHDEVNTLNK